MPKQKTKLSPQQINPKNAQMDSDYILIEETIEPLLEQAESQAHLYALDDLMITIMSLYRSIQDHWEATKETRLPPLGG